MHACRQNPIEVRQGGAEGGGRLTAHEKTTEEQAGEEIACAVGNAGPARGCVGRLISVTTDGETRRDVDPVQLRWAGLPRSRAFDPVDLRREQREYLNVLYLRDGDAWRLVTFEDPDFDPGFATDLPLEGRHTLQISIFADNADTVTSTLLADATADRHHVVLELM